MTRLQRKDLRCFMDKRCVLCNEIYTPKSSTHKYCDGCKKTGECIRSKRYYQRHKERIVRRQWPLTIFALDNDKEFMLRIEHLIKNMRGDTIGVHTLTRRAIRDLNRKVGAAELKRGYHIVAEMIEKSGGNVSIYLRGKTTPRWRVYKFG